MSTADDVKNGSRTDPDLWARTAEQPRYAQLKSRYKRFVLPAVIVTLAWYFTYVLLGTYAREFMSTPVFGSINVALLLGLSQLALSFVFAGLYIRFANRQLDPLSDELRAQAEGDAK